MQEGQRPLSRRQLISIGTLAISDCLLSGSCVHGTKVLKEGQIAPPAGVPLDSSLTIDVHCHIFNGTDLQVEKFIGEIEYPHWWGKAAGEILQLVNWTHAPSGDEEKARLKHLIHICRTADDGTQVRATVREKLAEHRSEGYQRARRAVLEVQKNSAQNPPIAAASPDYKSIQEAKQQIFTAFAAPNYQTLQEHLISPSPLGDNMVRELASPEPLQSEGQMAVKSRRAKSFGLRSAISFIVQYFQYRFVSAQDYLNVFTPSARRNVDLLLASMVDYDWWLAQGDPPRTPLHTQLDVMELISILSDGQVHGFAPFCPLREVAARAGVKNRNGETAWSSLEFVRNAIRLKGCVGVKLYPPMGFAAYGNASLDDPANGGDRGLWKGGLLPKWASEDIAYPDGSVAKLGKRLDDALDSLYRWCVDENVPILAHTDETNGPSGAYKCLAAAKYWEVALARYPTLRIDFGHLGGFDSQDAGARIPSTSQPFISMFNDNRPGAYGDLAYSSSMLLDQLTFDERVESSYKKASSEKNLLPSRLLYGTDWSLLEMVGDNELYMERFAQLFDGISEPACKGHSAQECFFGWNAVDYLGLRQGRGGTSTRSRLEAFYARNCIPAPAWMKKVGIDG